MSVDARNLRLILGRSAPQSASSLVVCEALNSVPSYVVEYINEGATLTELLGQKAEILLPETENGLDIAPRRFCGIVMEAELAGDDGSLTAFGRRVCLTVRPFLALLGYSSRCHVHQNKSSVDILTDILEFNGLKHSRIRVGASPPRREICIQYNEDDLSFVTRLLAEDGIAFYFGDRGDADVLVLHDSARPYPEASGGAIELTDASLPDAGRLRVDGLNRSSRACTGKVALTSYDVTRAAQNASGPDPVGETKGMGATGQTSHLAAVSGDLKTDERRRRAAEKHAETQDISGECEHPAAFLGQAVTITSSAADIAGDYVMSRLDYRASSGGRVHLGFTASPRATGPVPARPPKPIMPGLHNAFVVGGDPGMVVQDAQGRVKVRFAWDSSDVTRDTSCWLRVAMPLAGNGYGALFTPRAGHEVLVGFLNGDPDVPVIVGALYNGKNTHPYMAAGTTRSGVTSKLTQAETNELEFDDKPGAEKLCLRAAKDMEVTVAKAASTSIGTTEIRQVGGAATHGYDAGLDVEVADDASFKASTITLEAKSSLVLKVGSSKIEMTPSGITLKATEVKIDATKLDAKGSAQFKLSGASGSVEASGALDLKGMQLKAEGSAMATLKAGGMLTVQASGMTTVKGGIVQIN